MIRSRLTLAALAALTLPAFLACSGDAEANTVPSSSVPPQDIPACTKLYAEGKKITSKEFGQACVTEDGQLLTPLPIRITCEDDRKLLWNDLAYGYMNSEMKMTDVRQKVKIPQQLLDECLAKDQPAATAAG